MSVQNPGKQSNRLSPNNPTYYPLTIQHTIPLTIQQTIPLTIQHTIPFTIQQTTNGAYNKTKSALQFCHHFVFLEVLSKSIPNLKFLHKSNQTQNFPCFIYNNKKYIMVKQKTAVTSYKIRRQLP